MPIKVQCACGAAFGAKDELAGKTVKCPKCQQPLKIAAAGAAAPPAVKAAKPAKAAAAAAPTSASPAAKKPARPAAAAGEVVVPAPRDDLFDDLGLKPVEAGARPCPGCTEPLPENAVVCIKCGYNVKLGRRMETIKVGGGGGGEGGHGVVAQDLLDRAANVIDDDAAEEIKKTNQGMPWWVYLLGLVVIVGFLTVMMLLASKNEGKEEKKGALPAVESMQQLVEGRNRTRESSDFIEAQFA